MVLAPGRMQGIVEALTRDDWQVFPCHKTTHHYDDEEEDGYRPDGSEQACIGALAYTHKHADGMLPVLARIACARGDLQVDVVQANADRLEAPGKWKTCR